MNMNSSEIYNVSSNLSMTTSSPFVLNCYEDYNYFIRVVTDVWISFPLATLGILGNLMAFIVLCFYRQKLSTTILLQALALVDTLILLTVIPLRSLWISCKCFQQPFKFETGYKEPFKHMFYWMFPTLFVLRMIDTWLITLLTIDRWIAVCKPLHAQHLCRLGATYRRIAIIVVAALIFSFPRYLESRFYGIPDHINPEWERKKLYIYIYKITLFYIFMYLIPTAILIVLNIKLLISLKVTDPLFITRRHSTKNGTAGFSSQHRSITIIVIAVTTIYFLCSILAITSHTVYSLKQIDRLKDINITWLSNVNNIFITFNSASNFFIYCICSKNFRLVMYRTFGCRDKCSRLRPFRNASARTSSSNGTDYSSSLLQTTNISMSKYVKQNQNDTL